MSKNVNLFFATVAATALVACSTRPNSELADKAYARAVDQAFAELSHRANSSGGREVSSEQTIAQSIGAELRNLRGSVEVVVFPKLSSIGEKTRSPTRLGFGRPTTYTFNVVRNLACSKLLRENSDKWAHRENFADVDPNLDCAILRIFQTEPKRLASNARRGDVRETNLYIDSDYGVHGYDYEVLRTRRDSEIVHVKTDPLDASGSSGLGALPVDLPPPSPRSAVVLEDQLLKISTDGYVNRKLQELRIAPTCSRGKRITYRDRLGQPNITQWCRGDVWPTVVENARLLAVLKRGK